MLLSLALVVAAAQVGGAVFRLLRQPPVVGELLAGIALGPSAIGLAWPELSALVAPPASRPALQAVAQLGLVVFMLLVGLEVDLRAVTSRARLVTAVSCSSFALPFALGAGLALLLHAGHGVTEAGPVGRAAFVLVLGTAFAVTAFPVLARILHDRGLTGTPVGSTALACAAVTDVAAWLVLAVAVSLVSTSARPPAVVLLGAVAYTGAVLLLLRPALARLHTRGLLDRVERRALLAVLVTAALLGAWATESLGLHAVFGPFVVGLAVPRHAPTLELVHRRLGDVCTAVLLPAFFVVAGLGVDLTTLDGGGLLLLAAVVCLAIVGKVVGAAVPARWCGLSRTEALQLGALMNTRGLTELVVLSVGASTGVLDAQLYTVLVATAVLTTAATGPLLSFIGTRPPAPVGGATAW
ncbi:MAG: Kef-type transport system, rane component KefB [Frankiales bacterium]|nr:Kef-type transport system, rane component KefB [Frankiales bacterium]